MALHGWELFPVIGGIILTVIHPFCPLFIPATLKHVALAKQIFSKMFRISQKVSLWINPRPRDGDERTWCCSDCDEHVMLRQIRPVSPVQTLDVGQSASFQHEELHGTLSKNIMFVEQKKLWKHDWLTLLRCQFWSTQQQILSAYRLDGGNPWRVPRKNVPGKEVTTESTVLWVLINVPRRVIKFLVPRVFSAPGHNAKEKGKPRLF